MTTFIPIFPLNIVVYPSEKLNLHIFEPRYIQLVNDCIEQNKVFGIPAVCKETISEMGTTVRVLTIDKKYEDGSMDIKTQGEEVFKILELVNELPDKLYHGAIVHFPENVQIGIETKMKKLLNELRYFHHMLELSKAYKKADAELKVYDIAHHAGMSLEQEYELLTLLREDQRQEYLQRHLKQLIPTITELQNLKERIQLNGHFRKLSIDDKDKKSGKS